MSLSGSSSIGSGLSGSIQKSVNSNYGDAFEYLQSGEVYGFSEDYVRIGHRSYSNVPYSLITGFRFQAVIPNNAVISSAKLTVYAQENSTIDVQTKIFAEDVDDANSFSNSSNNLSNRTLTSSSIEWDISSSDAWVLNQSYDSPEIKTIIQEVVNRTGWSANNSIVDTKDDGHHQIITENTHLQRKLKLCCKIIHYLW